MSFWGKLFNGAKVAAGLVNSLLNGPNTNRKLITLDGEEYTLLAVDDSSDGTPQVTFSLVSKSGKNVIFGTNNSPTDALITASWVTPEGAPNFANFIAPALSPGEQNWVDVSSAFSVEKLGGNITITDLGANPSVSFLMPGGVEFSNSILANMGFFTLVAGTITTLVSNIQGTAYLTWSQQTGGIVSGINVTSTLPFGIVVQVQGTYQNPVSAFTVNVTLPGRSASNASAGAVSSNGSASFPEATRPISAINVTVIATGATAQQLQDFRNEIIKGQTTIKFQA